MIRPMSFDEGSTSRKCYPARFVIDGASNLVICRRRDEVQLVAEVIWTMNDVSKHAIVHVIDDEAGFRIAAADLIYDIGYCANPYGNGDDFLDAIGDCAPGLILLDMKMPDRSGFDVMTELSRRACDWPVIAMTAYGDIPMAVQAMRLGAYDFVRKPFTRHRLEKLLARALQDWADRETIRSTEDMARQKIRALTPREHDVLIGISEGKQNKAVAFDLDLSIRTVEMHRANMLARLNVKTVQEATALLMLSSRRAHPKGIDK